MTDTIDPKLTARIILTQLVVSLFGSPRELTEVDKEITAKFAELDQLLRR
jgi:hypothetical protein